MLQLQGGPQGEPRFPNPTLVNMRPPGFGPTPPRMPTQSSAPTVNPAPASLATLASQSSLNTKSAPSAIGSIDPSALSKPAEKVYFVS